MQPGKTGMLGNLLTKQTELQQTLNGKPSEGVQDLFFPQGVAAAHSKAARDAI